jgi:hypothetical protein
MFTRKGALLLARAATSASVWRLSDYFPYFENIKVGL